MHFEAGVGHIGGNLSALDVIMCLYHRELRSEDAFVLSKGHAAGALYIALWSKGILSDGDLETFHRDASRLSGHPPAAGIPAIAFATGSLGHGPGLACGLALAKRLRNEAGSVFCLTSDGEWNEGSCWEAIIFARHHGLSNLTLIVDLNGLQGFGTTRDVANLDSLADRLRAFDLRVLEVDGHDSDALHSAFVDCQSDDAPSVVIAKTRKGNGVSFMEGKMEWHYLPLDEAQYEQAIREVESKT